MVVRMLHTRWDSTLAVTSGSRYVMSVDVACSAVVRYYLSAVTAATALVYSKGRLKEAAVLLGDTRVC